MFFHTVTNWLRMENTKTWMYTEADFALQGWKFYSHSFLFTECTQHSQAQICC